PMVTVSSSGPGKAVTAGTLRGPRHAQARTRGTGLGLCLCGNRSGNSLAFPPGVTTHFHWTAVAVADGPAGRHIALDALLRADDDGLRSDHALPAELVALLDLTEHNAEPLDLRVPEEVDAGLLHAHVEPGLLHQHEFPVLEPAILHWLRHRIVE